MATEDIFDPLRQGATGVASGIGDAVSGIGSGIGDAVSGIGSGISNAVGGAVGGVGNYFKDWKKEDYAQLSALLGQVGAGLMAYGQPGYRDRTKALAMIGNAPGVASAMKSRLADANYKSALLQQQHRKLAALSKIDAMRATPEGILSIYKTTGLPEEFIKSATPEVLQDAMVKFAYKAASLTPGQRALREFMSGAATSGQAVANGGSAGPSKMPTAPRDMYEKYEMALKIPAIAGDTKAVTDIVNSMKALNPTRYNKQQENLAQYDKRGQALLGQIDKVKNVKRHIEDARKRYNLWSGTLGTYSQYVPFFNTYANDLDSSIKAVQSNIGFQTLNQMKADSKTGGALGNVSDKDLELLHSVLGKLSVGMSPKAFNAALNNIENVLTKTERRSRSLFETTYKEKFNPMKFGGIAGESVSGSGFKVIGVRDAGI